MSLAIGSPIATPYFRPAASTQAAASGQVASVQRDPSRSIEPSSASNVATQRADAVRATDRSEKASLRAEPRAEEENQASGKAAPNPASAEAEESQAPGALEEASDKPNTGGEELTEEQEEQVRELKQRDTEVRQHEQAHAAAGGPHAGSPQYEYTTGPDGKKYISGGEVPIDASPEKTPEQTLRKAEIVIRAATAPAEPSSQDRQVAAQAAKLRTEALAELRKQKEAEASGADEAGRSESGEPKSLLEQFATLLEGGEADGPQSGAQAGRNADNGKGDAARSKRGSGAAEAASAAYRDVAAIFKQASAAATLFGASVVA